jgi:beta-1,4-mannosyl-glycoprotein beta-1,4-N-acetylglucosaminyltransferase
MLSKLTTLVRQSKKRTSILRANFARRLSNLLPLRSHHIYDCFLFNNELDLLQIRLEELYDVVDYFVLCECATTFAGERKELHYALNKERFKAFHEKIIHFVIPDPPSSSYITNPANPEKKVSQFWQRNQMAVSFQQAKDHDLILISDLDEIPRSEVLADVYKLCYWGNCVVFFDQQWYQLFLNLRVSGHHSQVFARQKSFHNVNNERWLGTFSSTALRLRKIYNSDINAVWSMKWGQRSLSEQVFRDAGWHLSYMGGIDGVLKKFKANGMVSLSSRLINELRLGQWGGSQLQLEDTIDQLPRSVTEHPELWSHLINHQTSLLSLALELEQHLSPGDQSDNNR